MHIYFQNRFHQQMIILSLLYQPEEFLGLFSYSSTYSLNEHVIVCHMLLVVDCHLLLVVMYILLVASQQCVPHVAAVIYSAMDLTLHLHFMNMDWSLYFGMFNMNNILASTWVIILDMRLQINVALNEELLQFTFMP